MLIGSYSLILSHVYCSQAATTKHNLLKKHPLDITTNLKLTTTKKNKYISMLCLGNVTYFHRFMKIFLPQNSHLNPKIKLEFKRYLCLFPSVILSQSSTDKEEANELHGVRRTMEADTGNPKPTPTTTNQQKLITQQIFLCPYH